jgi:endoglucanase
MGVILSKEIELLEKLSNAFGPSGNEEDVAEILRKELEKYADETPVDKLGKLSRQNSHAAKFKITHPAKQ